MRSVSVHTSSSLTLILTIASNTGWHCQSKGSRWRNLTHFFSCENQDLYKNKAGHQTRAGIATSLREDGPEFEPRQGQASASPLGLTQTPGHQAPGLFPGSKVAYAWIWPLNHNLAPISTESGAIPLFPQYAYITLIGTTSTFLS